MLTKRSDRDKTVHLRRLQSSSRNTEEQCVTYVHVTYMLRTLPSDMDVNGDKSKIMDVSCLTCDKCFVGASIQASLIRLLTKRSPGLTWMASFVDI